MRWNGAQQGTSRRRQRGSHTRDAAERPGSIHGSSRLAFHEPPADHPHSTMTPRSILFPFAALCAAVLCGCAGGPSLHYEVDFAHRDSTGVPVTLVVEGVRDSLVLEGFEPAALMPVSGVAASVDGG